MRISEVLNEDVKKNRWVLIVTDHDKHEWHENLIELVKSAYKHTNLGSFVTAIQDVGMSDWVAQDWDEDPDLDCTVFYRGPRPNESWTGFKIQGIGHDGQPQSKQKVIERVRILLTKNGWWIESSDAMARTLGKLGVNPVTDEKLAQAIFPNSDLHMINHSGKYTRKAGNSTITETIYGQPVIK